MEHMTRRFMVLVIYGLGLILRQLSSPTDIVTTKELTAFKATADKFREDYEV